MKTPQFVWFRRLMVCALGVVAVGAATCARATDIAWSAAAGEPNMPAGAKVAFYIWHDGDAVHLCTTGNTKAGHKDWGSIVVTGGTVDGLHRVNLSASDLTEYSGKSEVIFHFETSEGVNQLYFYVTGGTKLKLSATHDGGALANMILYGASATPSKANPVTFDLTK